MIKRILQKVAVGFAAAVAICAVFMNIPARDGAQEALEAFAVIPTPEPTEAVRDYGELEAELRVMLKEKSGDWSLCLINYDTGQEIEINSHQVYSASLIKLFVAQTVYQQIADGAISDSDDIEDLLRRMITYSDNEAWRSIARKLGGGSYTRGMELVTNTAQAAGYGDTGQFFQGAHKNYNFTSVADCGKYLRDMLDGNLVSADYSAKILGYMLKQEILHKIPSGVPDGITVANKTGELDYMQGDAAVIYSPAATYILVIIGDSLTNAYATAPFFGEVSEVVYNFINENIDNNGQMEYNHNEGVTEETAAPENDAEGDDPV